MNRIATFTIHRPVARRWVLPLLALLVMGVGVAALPWARQLPDVRARFGLAPTRSVAYTFSDGYVVKIDPTTGAIVARTSRRFGDQFPSLAVSRDGTSFFLLHTDLVDSQAQDRLTEFSTQTMAPEFSVPLEHFMRPMSGWPPAIAVSQDDRTVIVSEYGYSPNEPEWLTYVDRSSGRVVGNRTLLPGCGLAQIVPAASRVAVLCFQSNDVRLVDLKSHQVDARVFLDLQDSGVIGFPVAAAVIPGQDALAVVQDHGGLLRVDLASRKVSLIANLVPNNGEFAPVTGAAFSSNGEAVVAIATSNHDRSVGRAMTLLVVDTTSGRVQGRWLAPSWYGISVSPDGRSVYSRGDRGDLERLDLTSGAVKPLSPAPRYTWFHLIFPGQ